MSNQVFRPDRRQALVQGLTLALGCLSPLEVMAMGEEDRFTIATLRYRGGTYNPRPTAMRRLLLELEKRTSVEIDSKSPELRARDKKLFDHPMLYWGGDRKFGKLPARDIKRLRTYLQSGGFLLVDSAEGLRSGPFLKSVQRELKRIFPDKALGNVPRDHVLYKSFYLIKEPTGRVMASKHLQAIFIDDRLPVVVSANDMMGALARDSFGNWEYEVTPGGQQQRELTMRLGINMAMYALCQNYKADQVHIPFILKRRKWKVD